MKISLELLRDGIHEIYLQDGSSDIPYGCCRVLMDFVTPVRKRVELNNFTDLSSHNFVNPQLNPFIVIRDKSLNLDKYNTGVYEIDYWIHYPGIITITGMVGDNIVRGTDIGSQFLNTDMIFIGDEHYQIDRRFSTDHELFLNKRLETNIIGYEIAFHKKVFLPLVASLTDDLLSVFKTLLPDNASRRTEKKFDDLILTTFMTIAAVANCNEGNVDFAKKQVEKAKQLIEDVRTNYKPIAA